MAKFNNAKPSYFCTNLIKQPNVQGMAVARARRAERTYSTFKVRTGNCEKIPLVQGKEQWLRFAGAAGKRYRTSKIREAQVGW